MNKDNNIIKQYPKYIMLLNVWLNDEKNNLIYYEAKNEFYLYIFFLSKIT
jgi:hypothetical protein